MILYHYTCAHCAPGIDRDRHLRPCPQPALGGVWLAWLTDLDRADSAALGLTASWLVDCDRTAVQVTIDAAEADVEPWTRWAHRHKIARTLRDQLEIAGTYPAHWWVARAPLRVASLGEEARP